MTLKTTFRSKLSTFALALLVMVLGAVAPAFATGTPAAAGTAAAPAPSAERMALAKKYIDTVPVEAEVKAAVEKLSSSVAPEQRVLYRSIADSSIDFQRLRSEATTAIAAMFTEDEIKAMTTFFGSPEGKAIRAKMPAYEARMQPVMMELMQAFVMKLQENKIQITPPTPAQ